jgi:hypothetical protein
MPHKTVSLFIVLICSSCIPAVYSQQVTKYNLSGLAGENKLETTAAYPQVQTADSSMQQAINLRGIVWLKGVVFETGTVDVDIRGRNVFLQSFPGIAFHAKDTTAYDVVYFCPFRFHDTAEETRKYSVKYMSVPDYSYTRLRKEQPGLYENEVKPAPDPADWFHATIVIDKDWITVYVNHAAIPSLKVRKLPTLPSGKIGLWSFSRTLSSDFANLVITQ